MPAPTYEWVERYNRVRAAGWSWDRSVRIWRGPHGALARTQHVVFRHLTTGDPLPPCAEPTRETRLQARVRRAAEQYGIITMNPRDRPSVAATTHGIPMRIERAKPQRPVEKQKWEPNAWEA